MHLVRLLRDFLLVHRRAAAGMCILITAAVLLAFYSGQVEGAYRDLFRLQEHNAPVFYVTFTALLVLAFLTSIFPASLLRCAAPRWSSPPSSPSCLLAISSAP
jgi:hypothetical protein